MIFSGRGGGVGRRAIANAVSYYMQEVALDCCENCADFSVLNCLTVHLLPNIRDCAGLLFIFMRSLITVFIIIKFSHNRVWRPITFF